MATKPDYLTPELEKRIEELKALPYADVITQSDAIVLANCVWQKGGRGFGGAAVWYAPPGTTRFFNNRIEFNGVWVKAILINVF